MASLAEVVANNLPAIESLVFEVEYHTDNHTLNHAEMSRPQIQLFKPKTHQEFIINFSIGKNFSAPKYFP